MKALLLIVLMLAGCIAGLVAHAATYEPWGRKIFACSSSISLLCLGGAIYVWRTFP